MSSEKKPDNIELNVKLTMEDTINKICSAVDKDIPFSIFRYTGDNPLIGKIKGRSFRIRLKTTYANSWRPILYGKIEPLENGCRIQAIFGEYWFTRFFTILLFGIAVLFAFMGLIIVYADFVKRTFDISALAIIFVSLGFLAFGICLRSWGKKTGK